MPYSNSEQSLPEFPEPCWGDSVKLPKFDSLKEDIQADVVIVGGGITGITASYLLVNEGLKVALLDAGNLLNGTTGHTTAKITAQHNLIYDELIQHMGKSKARLYYEANSNALHFIKKTIHDLQIQCDFSQEDALVYATTEQYARKVEQEYKAYQELGIEGNLVDQIPFPIKIRNALSMKNQAQFHPLKYLVHLVQLITEKGGKIYEHTTAVDVENGDKPTVITRDGHRASADKVLSCSHFPFYDGPGLYFTRMYAERAYVVAGILETEYPGGMYISADYPTRSLRSLRIDNQTMVLITGEGHKTGQGKDTLEHYKALESFGQEVLGIKEFRYRWSTQDLYTLDKVAYIGELAASHPNVLVATGYRKWGMSTGTAASLLLRDHVLNRDNPFKQLYTPSRFYMDPSLKTFFTQNANVAGHLVKGKFELIQKEVEDLNRGEGGVVTFNGSRAGAYKDDEGNVYVVDTTCTHLRCEVEWNHGDRTWDCPCHGSRFSYKGDVVEGPAEKPLKRLK